MTARRGRPLRFLGTALAGWAALRVATVWSPAWWPAEEELALVGTPVRQEAPAVASLPPKIALTRAPRVMVARPALPFLARRTPVGTTPAAPPLVDAPEDRPVTAVPSAPAPNAATIPTPIGHPPQPPSRWSASAWAIARGGGGAGLATPQLGGSQAGARVAFLLAPAAGIALVARAAAALETVQQEAAVGVEWRLPGLPVRLVAEQRIGLRAVRGGPALGIVGGVGPVPVGGALTVDGYGQAGVVLRDGGGDGYADGTLRVARPLGGGVSAGVAAWGAAQRGAARLDAGPGVALVLPGTGVRVSAEWRARIAGNARPASGPALTVGADF